MTILEHILKKYPHLTQEMIVGKVCPASFGKEYFGYNKCRHYRVVACAHCWAGEYDPTDSPFTPGMSIEEVLS